MVTRRTVLGGTAALVATSSSLGVVGETGGNSDSDGSLEVSSTAVRFDESVDVRVTDLTPGSEVTLAAQVPDGGGNQWSSFARFEASADGVVDPASHAPMAGTYEGVRRMGFVSSMQSSDATSSIYVPPEGTADLTLTASVDGRQIDRRTVTRRFGPETLEVRSSPDDLVGALFRPQGDGPFPAVIVLHGSGGEADVGTALMLAARGYAAFAPQYFGSPDPLPDQLAEVPLEYLQRGYEWMRDLPAVRDAPVGLLGSSKGAEMALLAGATYDWVGAVAAYAPSGVVWAGLTYGGETVSSWTLDGEPIPFLPTAFPPSVVADYAASWPLGGSVSLRPTYEEPLRRATDDRIEEATIPVEGVDGPVTLVSGGRDELWPSVRLSEFAVSRLRERDHPHPVRHLSFENAGHAISFPYQPTTGLDDIGGPLPGTGLALGGTSDGLARAARESWPAVLSTFEEGLR